MKKPSVTRLLDLMNKPAIIKWANKQGLDGIEINAYSASVKKHGTELHSQIDSAINGNVVFDCEQTSRNFASFMQGKTPIAIEKNIETEWFVGRFDFAYADDDGELFVVDWKRSKRGRVYLEHKLQLVAYTMAFPAKMAIVQVPQFNLIPVEIDDRSPYEEMLKTLSKLYQLKKEIENE